MKKVQDEHTVPPVRRGILIVSSVLGSALVLLACGFYLATGDAEAALPLIFGLLLLLPLAASRRRPVSRERQLENVRRYSAAMVICGAVWFACYGIVFLGTLAMGPSFVRGSVGKTIIELGVAFFGVSLLLVFLYAYAEGALSRSSDDEDG